MDLTNTTWTFPAGAVKDGDNVITVAFDQTGIEEDYDGTDAFKVDLDGCPAYLLTVCTRHLEVYEDTPLTMELSISGS